MRSAAIRSIGGGLALVVLGSAVVGLQMTRERRFPAAEPAQQMLYVSSPAALKRMALSFDVLLADLYWIRAIQYYGGARLSETPTKNYELLYPLLDLTTSLDPQFSIAYRFGAFFLSEEAPGGAGRPDLATRLLEKGMRANPMRWEYPHDIAFVFYRRGDFARAAEWFRRASEVPGAAEWLAPMAAVTLARGGDTAAARLLWKNILAGIGEQDWIKRLAEQRLQQLDAIDMIAGLERVTAEYEKRFGDPPKTWEDLVRLRMLPGIPFDSAGIPFVLNPWWGSVTVSEESPLWPLPGQQPL